jgi:hypothetical protein
MISEFPLHPSSTPVKRSLYSTILSNFKESPDIGGLAITSLLRKTSTQITISNFFSNLSLSDLNSVIYLRSGSPAGCLMQ